MYFADFPYPFVNYITDSGFFSVECVPTDPQGVR